MTPTTRHEFKCIVRIMHRSEFGLQELLFVLKTKELMPGSESTELFSICPL
jgi:hypothetical protein